MKTITTICLTLMVLSSPGWAHDKHKPKAYALIQVDIIDQDLFFNGYGPAAAPTLEKYKAKVLVATFDKRIREGEWMNNWTVVLEFPSMRKANKWYYSEAYQAAIPLRQQAAGFTNMVFVPQFVEP